MAGAAGVALHEAGTFDIRNLPAFADGTDWRDYALCAETDPEAFFDDAPWGAGHAKLTCVGCEVRAECLQFALMNDERFGIWGGLGPRERRELRAGRRFA